MEELSGLAVRHVSVTFGGLAALDEVSMHVDPGEVVGVIGPNGAGKTTLFNVICGFVRPDTGTISYRGQLLVRHDPHDLAPLGIARTLQGVGLWRGLTVAENVMAGAQAAMRADFVSSLLGLWRSSREESRLRQQAMGILGELRIAEFADSHPQALPYAIQKRVSLARALASEPSLLLLDEPASGLSAAEMEEMRELIRRLRDRMGVLLVEHHMDLVMSTCDRLVVLNFGRVIASGSPSQVSADPEVTTAYLGEDVARVRPVDHSKVDHSKVDHGTADLGTADRGSVDRGSVDRGSVDRGSVDRGSVDKGTAGDRVLKAGDKAGGTVPKSDGDRGREDARG